MSVDWASACCCTLSEALNTSTEWSCCSGGIFASIKAANALKIPCAHSLSRGSLQERDCLEQLGTAWSLVPPPLCCELLEERPFLSFFFFGCTLWHAGPLFPSQGLYLYPLHWECRVLTTGPPRKSLERPVLFIPPAAMRQQMKGNLKTLFFPLSFLNTQIPSLLTYITPALLLCWECAPSPIWEFLLLVSHPILELMVGSLPLVLCPFLKASPPIVHLKVQKVAGLARRGAVPCAPRPGCPSAVLALCLWKLQQHRSLAALAARALAGKPSSLIRMPGKWDLGKQIDLNLASEGTAKSSSSTLMGLLTAQVSLGYKCPAPESLLSHTEDNFMIQKVKNWNKISSWQGAIDRGWERAWPQSSELHKPRSSVLPKGTCADHSTRVWGAMWELWTAVLWGPGAQTGLGSLSHPRLLPSLLTAWASSSSFWSLDKKNKKATLTPPPLPSSVGQTP